MILSIPWTSDGAIVVPMLALGTSLLLIVLSFPLGVWRSRLGRGDGAPALWAGRIALGLTVIASCLSVARMLVGETLSGFWFWSAVVVTGVGFLSLCAYFVASLIQVSPGKPRTPDSSAVVILFLATGAVLVFGAWLDLNAWL